MSNSFDPQTQHHPFCNWFMQPREGCRLCESLYASCPYDGSKTPAEIIAERWPEAIIVK